MKESSGRENFLKQIRKGREFEEWERSFWVGEEHNDTEFEALTKWDGMRGRIDIRLRDDIEEAVVVVELKASNWDRMQPHRVRPNALRHARQIWRYIEAELEKGLNVRPGLVYPTAPKTPGRQEEIEKILNERLIQVAWRE